MIRHMGRKLDHIAYNTYMGVYNMHSHFVPTKRPRTDSLMETQSHRGAKHHSVAIEAYDASTSQRQTQPQRLQYHPHHPLHPSPSLQQLQPPRNPINHTPRPRPHPQTRHTPRLNLRPPRIPHHPRTKPRPHRLRLQLHNLLLALDLQRNLRLPPSLPPLQHRVIRGVCL